MERTQRKPNLHALVDMGSNGIRFSISDLSPSTARILPTLFQDRAGISLYDAQYSTGVKAAIPFHIISEVIRAMQRFQRTCEDFGVPSSNVSVLATEATREAINSVSFRQQIKDATGWEVQMLPKEEEGRVGAMGVASSARSVQGLIMDLGGGSVQLTWMTEVDGAVSIADGASVSLPYGAAALLRRLQEAEELGAQQVDALAQEVRARITEEWEAVRPKDPTQARHFPLFLSGGGFRGWGNVLLDSHHVQPYPIPIIDGFTVPASAFRDTMRVQSDVAQKGSSIFRVSERRAGQIPAVSFLVTQMTAALPAVSSVRFAQGGVREGFLFSGLPAEVRKLIPLEVASSSFAPASVDQLVIEMRHALPDGLKVPSLMHNLVRPIVNLLYHASSYPREARAAVALRMTTTGVLAGVHGLSHDERAALSLILCERWGGLKELSPTDIDFFQRLQSIVTPAVAWWSRYLGRVGALLGYRYPAGVVRDKKDHIIAEATDGQLVLHVRDIDGDEGYQAHMEKIEKLGKKKNWIGGKDGWGLKIHLLNV